MGSGAPPDTAFQFLFFWAGTMTVTGIVEVVLLLLMFNHLRTHHPDTYEELGPFLSMPTGFTRGNRGTQYLLLRFLFSREYARLDDARLERLGNLARLGILWLMAGFVGGWLIFIALALRGS
jgi:hypothetical protein